jgi:hypothetical protein
MDPKFILLVTIVALLFPVYAVIGRLSWFYLLRRSHRTLYRNPRSLCGSLFSREDYIAAQRRYPSVFAPISRAIQIKVPGYRNELLAVCWPIIPLYLLGQWICKRSSIVDNVKQIDSMVAKNIVGIEVEETSKKAA